MIEGDREQNDKYPSFDESNQDNYQTESYNNTHSHIQNINPHISSSDTHSINNQIDTQQNENNRMEEDNKQAILHLETLNMMTKYQLVFIKLESSMAKIFSNAKIYKRSAGRAMHVWLRNARIGTMSLKYRSAVCVHRMRERLLPLVQIKRRQERGSLQRAVGKWRHQMLLMLTVNKLNRSILDLESLMQRNMAAKDQKNAALEKKILEKEKESANALAQLKSVGEKATEKEKTIAQLNEQLAAMTKKAEELEKAKGSRAAESEQRKNLHAVVESLRKENADLKEQLEATECNVGGFIEEMSTLLDSHEFGKFSLEGLGFTDSDEVEEDILSPHAAAAPGGGRPAGKGAHGGVKGVRGDGSRGKGVNTKYRLQSDL